MLRPRKRFRFEPLEQRQLMAVVSGDFNGDGFDDTANGEPREAHSNELLLSGFVSVQYGSESGMKDTQQVIHQDIPGVPGLAEDFDNFGFDLDVGDFNGDGYDDLVVSAPGEGTSGQFNGAVHIFYGSFAGLDIIAGSRLLTGFDGSHFGTSLAVGNFNGDFNLETGLPLDDLAIGVPRADLGVDSPILPDFADGHHEDAGAVLIYYGSADGIGLARSQTLTQEGNFVGDPESGDFFGSSLAAGDFNRDGIDDLAIGAPNEDISTNGLWENKDDAGSVYVVTGSLDGLTDESSYSINRDTANVDGGIKDKERFGNALFAADVDGNGFDELLIASFPTGGEGFSSLTVLYDNFGRLGDGGGETFVQSFNPLTQNMIAFGDFDGDFVTDIAYLDGGELVELHHDGDQLRIVRRITPFTPGIEANSFDFKVTAGNYNDDRFADVAIYSKNAEDQKSPFDSTIFTGGSEDNAYAHFQVIEGSLGNGLQATNGYLVDLSDGRESGGGFSNEIYDDSIFGNSNFQNWIDDGLFDNGLFLDPNDYLDATDYFFDKVADIEEDVDGNEWLTHPATVEKLYFQILGRAPDAGGLTYQVDRLENGAKLSAVAAGIFESPERLDPIVSGMYRDFLLRDAGPEEIAYYRDQWQREGSPDGIRANIISSVEFYQSAGNTDAGWVNELYQRLLKRTAGETEVQYWTDRLAAGAGRRQVVFGFLHSAENFSNLASLWYVQYLNRQAAAEEVFGIVSDMQAGATQRDIQMRIIDLEEFRKIQA